MDKFMCLSKTMIDVLDKMKEHGKLVRYCGGFWSWEDVEIKKLLLDEWIITIILHGIAM